jgi:hypothetical protein
MNVLADKAVQEKRRSICDACEFKKQMPLTKIEVCGVCGCPLRSKTSLQRATCPKGKW